MASFDIKSLFPNIPLDETIDTIISELFNKPTYFQCFTRKEFITLFILLSKIANFYLMVFIMNRMTELPWVPHWICFHQNFS